MKRNKSGISLIVLVITIIVMIILAAAVVIALDNSGIINKANEAVDSSNLKQVQHLASLIWADAYLDEDIKKEDITADYIRQELADQGVSTDAYDVIVEENGVAVKEKITIPDDWKSSVREITEDGVPIPVGFVKSPYPNEGAKNTGLVIYALTETEITEGKTTITDDHQTALETRNQFVWVPVDSNNFETLFKRTAFRGETLSTTTLGTEYYWELVLDSTNMPSATQDTDYVSASTLQEATAMYASVKKYGGFYIARYEAGEDDSEALSITMGKYPLSYSPWGDATMLSRSFYPSTSAYGAVSTLTYGVQWDRTLNWWKELDPNFDLENSSDYGVFDDTGIELSEFNVGAKSRINYDPWEIAFSNTDSYIYHTTTGAFKGANVYNIYDMAGNISEWTMEGSETYYRVMRGLGPKYQTTTGISIALRTRLAFEGEYYAGCGFRPSLYIK